MNAVVTAGSTVVLGLIGYRKAGFLGALAGGAAGYVVVPWAGDKFLEAVFPYGTIEDKSQLLADNYAGLHIGSSVVRPSIAGAVTLWRQLLPLFPNRWLAAAAIVNSYAESRFDPLAAGDVDVETNRPRAIGLWQLHEDGAGSGMSVAARKDPVVSTTRILQVARGAGVTGDEVSKGWLEAAYDASPLSYVLAYGETPVGKMDEPSSPPDVAELVETWCRQVERPAHAELQSAQRVAAFKTDNYLRAVLTALGLPTS